MIARTHKRRRASSLLGHCPPVQQRALRHLRGNPERNLAQPQPPAEALSRQAEIEQELQLARDIQQGLLLEAVPHLPGWELSAVSLPARDLGGDLYDFLPLGDRRHGVMIGDVSGKGLPAALRMAVARTVFRHEARSGDDPGCTLAAVNRSVIREIPQGMVTMLYVIVDTQHGLLRFANAGHNYPLLLNGVVGELLLSGLPLGVDDESDYSELVAELCPGDLVVLYTDGVTEAVGSDGSLYGFERLKQLIETNQHWKPRALVAALLHELRAWSGTGRQTDDITLVVLRRRLAQLGAELRVIADDVLGSARAADLWDALKLPGGTASSEQWTVLLPQVVAEAQKRCGRGLARELHQELRVALEEYR